MLARHPRVLLWTIGLANCKLVTQIMLAHLCREEYHPFGKTIACLVVLLALAMIQLVWHLQGGFQWAAAMEDLQLYFCFGLCLFSYIHLVWSMVVEVSRALGIYAFVITRKRRAKTD